MKGFDWLINAIENMRIGTIQNRRYMDKNGAQVLSASVDTMMALAKKDAENGGLYTQADRQDFDTAQVCKDQYQELLSVLLSQLPD